MWLFIAVNTFLMNYVRLSHGMSTKPVSLIQALELLVFY